MACSAPQILVGTVDGQPFYLPDSDFENAQTLLSTVSDDQGDPTLDEYTENIASGNNSKATTGVQIPSTPEGKPPVQTSPPPPIAEKAEQVIDKPAPGGNGAVPSSIVWDGENYDIQLSPNYKLSAFTVKCVFPYPLIDYVDSSNNIPKQTRFDNLRALAINCVEPLLAKFGPTLKINSGIRNKTSTPPPGLSQHISGQACDIQFTGMTYANYWENAQWVKDNIPFDQFIFEHSSSTGLAWFHLSYNTAGNRPASVRTKVMTMYRNQYDAGLKRYG